MPKQLFEKGNPGGPGRPKGSKTPKIREIRATVNAQVMAKLEGLLEKSYSVIDERLDDGDPKVAMWLLERLTKADSSMLPDTLDITLSTMDDVMVAAQLSTEMVMQRKLTIDDGLKCLNMLNQYAGFRAFERMDELKKMIEDMNAANEAKTVNGGATMPSWGRLATHQGNTKPAE